MDEELGQSEDESGNSEDVASLVAMLKHVRNDNIELKRNFESLKGLHLQLHDDQKQLQEQYGALYEERVNVEKQYQALCESWRLELEEKQRQFEQVKSQLVGPRDLELIKVTMMEKIEAPFRAKCDMLVKEAESSQQNFVRQRRDFEELQAAYKTLELHSQRDREILEADATSTINQLRDQLAVMAQAQVKLANAERTIKILQREKSDLMLQLGKMSEEIEDLRQAKDKAYTEKDTIELRVDSRLKNIQAEEMQLSGLVETLTRKNRHLQKEMAEAHRSNEEMFDQRLKLQTAQAALQSQLESMNRQHAAEFQAQEDQHLSAARALEDKLLTLRDQLHSKERQLAELHITHQEQITQVVESQSLRLQELEKEHSSKTREIKDHNAEVSARADVLKDSLEDCRRELDDLQHRYKREVESSQRNLERVQAQLAESQGICTSKEADVAELKGELDKLKSDLMRLQHEKEQVTSRRDELVTQIKKLNEELVQVQDLKRDAEKVGQELKRKSDLEKATYFERLEQQRQSFATEKSVITKRFQVAIKEQSVKADADMKKLKRRVKAAEEQAMKLNNELTDLRLRAHELEVGGFDTSYRDNNMAVRATQPMMLTSSSKIAPSPGRVGNLLDNGVGSLLSAEIDALRLRQKEYLKATEH